MTDTSLIPEKEVMNKLGVSSRQTIWNYTKRHGFPKPVRTHPNHTFVKLLRGGFLTVALIRNAPDVPEQFISVKLIHFALSLYPVVFIVY